MKRVFLTVIVAGLVFTVTGIPVQSITNLPFPNLSKEAKAAEDVERRKRRRRRRRAARQLNQSVGTFRPGVHGGAQIIIVGDVGAADGYQVGDEIVAVDGQPTTDEISVAEYFFFDENDMPRPVGTPVEIIVRDGLTGSYECTTLAVPQVSEQ